MQARQQRDSNMRGAVQSILVKAHRNIRAYRPGLIIGAVFLLQGDIMAKAKLEQEELYIHVQALTQLRTILTLLNETSSGTNATETKQHYQTIERIYRRIEKLEKALE